MRASQVVKCQSLFIGIAILFPSSAFFLQCCLIWDALIQALPRQNAEFNLCHIEPTPMPGSIVKF